MNELDIIQRLEKALETIVEESNEMNIKKIARKALLA